MKKTFYTPDGIETRDLTYEEIQTFAAEGDADAKKAIAIDEIKYAADNASKIDAIIKYLGLK